MHGPPGARRVIRAQRLWSFGRERRGWATRRQWLRTSVSSYFTRGGKNVAYHGSRTASPGNPASSRSVSASLLARRKRLYLTCVFNWNFGGRTRYLAVRSDERHKNRYRASTMENPIHDLRRSLDRERRGTSSSDPDVAVVRPHGPQLGPVVLMLGALAVFVMFVQHGGRREDAADTDPLFQRF